jgi:putative intracellular protease/amidase
MAVICHVPRGLVPAGPARGRAVISYDLRDELRDAGRHRGRSGGGVHGNLVTGRQPGDVPALTGEVLTVSAAARGA